MKDGYTAPCDKCGGKCCSYVAIELDKPKSKRDYDNMRWYLAHKNVNVFIDHSKKWHVEFRTPCEFMDRDNRCRFYDTRPVICREYGTAEGDCEFYDTPYLEFFTTCEELETYLDQKKIEWRFKNRN